MSNQNTFSVGSPEGIFVESNRLKIYISVAALSLQIEDGAGKINQKILNVFESIENSLGYK